LIDHIRLPSSNQHVRWWHDGGSHIRVRVAAC